ncbi:amino acid-binding protein [Alphaproteobacteria bacterium AO1-B]|nr:amino acid-binding protein [Alphaproteobacteria bacterium AO1-B]
MQDHLVFTVIAEDRSGLVEKIADVIAGAGGNWIESSMARLGGEFAGIVRISVPAENASQLTAALKALGSDGIDITLRSGQGSDNEALGASAHLDLVSQDHPGILRDITHILSEHKVSIEYLETSVEAGSMQGGFLFKASADLRLPTGLTPAQLSDALQATAADLMADISLAE